MANYGATLKNYAMTLTTALCGVAITLKFPALFLAALLPVIVFASLDAKYLNLERRFRALFDKTRAERWDDIPSFCLDLTDAPKLPFHKAIFSWSVLGFYGPLALGVSIIYTIWASANGRFI